MVVAMLRLYSSPKEEELLRQHTSRRWISRGHVHSVDFRTDSELKVYKTGKFFWI